MRALYGILGNGKAPAKVINAALDDIGTGVDYHLPWYGKPSSALEMVYDWMLDNEASFFIVGKNVPKVLSSAAKDVMDSSDPDRFILDTLRFSDNKGTVLFIWDDEDTDTSHRLANASIEHGLTTLELTNGLVPIVLSDEDQVVEEDPTDDEPQSTPEEFDRETVESMPAAVVKRMAKDKGHVTKTKDEALKVLFETGTEQEPDLPTKRRIVRVVVHYDDGMVMEL